LVGFPFDPSLKADERGPLAVQGILFMRKIVLAAAVASAALALSACKKDADDVAAVASDAVTDASTAADAAGTAMGDAAAAGATTAASVASAASSATVDTAKDAAAEAEKAASDAQKKM
jgi:hypothetical protein